MFIQNQLDEALKRIYLKIANHALQIDTVLRC
jgi:hypothetical protein